MTTPDSPPENTVTLPLLEAVSRSSKNMPRLLNALTGVTGSIWLVAAFVYPLPWLGWATLAFGGVNFLYNIGSVLVDRHAAMAMMLSSELEITQQREAQKTIAELHKQTQSTPVLFTTGHNIVPKSSSGNAIGLTGRQVN